MDKPTGSRKYKKTRKTQNERTWYRWTCTIVGSLCHEQLLMNLCLLFCRALSLLLSYLGTMSLHLLFFSLCSLTSQVYRSLSCLCTQSYTCFSLALNVSISISLCFCMCHARLKGHMLQHSKTTMSIMSNWVINIICMQWSYINNCYLEHQMFTIAQSLLSLDIFMAFIGSHILFFKSIGK